jgi:hypothetical protein
MWRVRLVLLGFVLVLLAVLAAALAVLVAAIIYLPAWVWLVIVPAVLLTPFVLRQVVRWRVRSFLKELEGQTPPGMPPGFASLFKMKGSVLRGARVVVHSLEPAEPPPAREDSPAPGAGQGETAPEAGARVYYRLEVTIKPTRWGVGFKLWVPGDLRLVSPDSGWMDEDDCCAIETLEVMHGGGYGPEDEMRYGGAQRLRLLLAVRPGTRRLAFQYYTEKFGDIALPEAAPAG